MANCEILKYWTLNLKKKYWDSLGCLQVIDQGIFYKIIKTELSIIKIFSSKS